MRPELRLPIGVWIATTLVVVIVALQIEALIYVAVPYLVLNGLALWLGLVRKPPLSDRAEQVLAWCTAAQLPTMLMVIFDVEGNRSPRKRMKLEAQQQLEANARRDDRPSSTPADRRLTKSTAEKRTDGSGRTSCQ